MRAVIAPPAQPNGNEKMIEKLIKRIVIVAAAGIYIIRNVPITHAHTRPKAHRQSDPSWISFIFTRKTTQNDDIYQGSISIASVLFENVINFSFFILHSPLSRNTRFHFAGAIASVAFGSEKNE